jgi:hypothetical protein
MSASRGSILSCPAERPQPYRPDQVRWIRLPPRLSSQLHETALVGHQLMRGSSFSNRTEVDRRGGAGHQGRLLHRPLGLPAAIRHLRRHVARRAGAERGVRGDGGSPRPLVSLHRRWQPRSSQPGRSGRVRVDPHALCVCCPPPGQPLPHRRHGRQDLPCFGRISIDSPVA